MTPLSAQPPLFSLAFVRRYRLAISLTVLLIFTAAIGLRMTFGVPLYGKPQEDLHAEVVDAIKLTHSLPLVKAGTTRQEFHQPPLYYVTVALASFFDPPMPTRLDSLPRNDHFLTTYIGNRDPYLPTDEGAPTIYVGRIISLLSVLIAVVAVWAAGRLFLGGAFALLAALLLAAHPEYLFIGTSMSNDAITVSAVAVSLWWISRLMRQGLTRRGSFVLGLLIGIGILCKVHAILVLGCLPFLFWHHRTQPLRELFVDALLIAVGLLLVSGFWMVRNQLNYGDPLALGLVMPGVAKSSVFNYLLIPLTDLWRSLWLDFSPGQAGYAPDFYYVVVEGILAVAALGVVIVFLRNRPQRIYLAMHAFFAILVLAVSLWQKAHELATGLALVPVAEGRHTLIALPSIAILVAAAFQAIPAARLRVVAMAGFAVVVVGTLLWAAFPYSDQAFGTPPVIRAKPVPSLDQPVRFANGMQLIALQLSPGRFRNADGWWVDLEWTTSQPISQNLSESLQILDWQNNLLVNRGQQDSYPGDGLWPTTLWWPGIHVFDHHFVNSASGTQFGVFIFDLKTGQQIQTETHQVALFPLK